MAEISLENTSKKFKIGSKASPGALARAVSFFSGKEPKKIFWALKNISFEAGPGEIIGIIGKNGSGKSTLLKMIAGIHKCDQGSLRTEGRIISLINIHAGLNERLTMEEAIILYAAFLNIEKIELKKIYGSIIDFSGLKNYTNTKLYQFSSGMIQRLVFSIAAFSRPDILLLDEILAFGDIDFEKKCLKKINEFSREKAIIVFASHGLEVVLKHASRVLWLENGRIIKAGRPQKIIEEYRNDKEKT